MRLLFINNFYQPFVFGGAEIGLHAEITELRRRGHQISVITLSENRKPYTEKIDDITIYRIAPFNLYPACEFQNKPLILKPLVHTIDIWNPSSYAAINKILCMEKPDIVHINNFKGISLSAFDSVKRANLPCIFTIRDYSLICPRATLLRASNKICNCTNIFCLTYKNAQNLLISGKVDAFIAPSKFIVQKMKEHAFFVNLTANILPTGINLNSASISKKYHNINILYLGALNENKGTHILIQAFNKLNHKNVTLNIVGKGPAESSLKELAGNNPNIIFHGFLSIDEKNNLLTKMNIAVVPSLWYDNGPAVVYECFNYSIPIIGSNIGGIPDLVNHGSNGMLFEPGNIDELMSILQLLIKDLALLENLERGAFAASRNYDIADHVSKLEKIYQSMIRK